MNFKPPSKNLKFIELNLSESAKNSSASLVLSYENLTKLSNNWIREDFKPQITKYKSLKKSFGLNFQYLKLFDDKNENVEKIDEFIQKIILEIIKNFSKIFNSDCDKKLPYFTPSEVVIHNQVNDCWVSILNNVYDLTPLIEQYKNSKLVQPLITFAGKDISHWFDENRNIKYYVHPITFKRVPYLPYGSIPDIDLLSSNSNNQLPWWKNSKYKIGKLSEKSRPIRILNMLTGFECTIEVCKEDTIQRISERLNHFNSHGNSYTWKFESKILDINKTLEENGIPDERDYFVDLFLPENLYTPCLCLYFNDDLKWDIEINEF